MNEHENQSLIHRNETEARARQARNDRLARTRNRAYGNLDLSGFTEADLTKPMKTPGGRPLGPAKPKHDPADGPYWLRKGQKA